MPPAITNPPSLIGDLTVSNFAGKCPELRAWAAACSRSGRVAGVTATVRGMRPTPAPERRSVVCRPGTGTSRADGRSQDAGPDGELGSVAGGVRAALQGAARAHRAPAVSELRGGRAAADVHRAAGGAGGIRGLLVRWMPGRDPPEPVSDTGWRTDGVAGHPGRAAGGPGAELRAALARRGVGGGAGAPLRPGGVPSPTASARDGWTTAVSAARPRHA